MPSWSSGVTCMKALQKRGYTSPCHCTVPPNCCVCLMMKCQRRSFSSCSRRLFARVLSFVLVFVVVAANCRRSTTKSPRLRHHLPGTAFISGTHLFQDRRQRSGQAPSNAYLSRSGVDLRTDGSGPSGIAVHDEAWYLGDGGFAARHLEDDDRISAKKVCLN